MPTHLQLRRDVTRTRAKLSALRSRAAVSVLCLALITASGCGGDGSDDCVPCDATATGSGIGQLEFGASQGIADDLRDSCGYKIHSGHAGAVGDTLQVAHCFEGSHYGIVLVWAYGRFSGYRICDPGFQGTIQGGTPLGDGECRVVGDYYRN